MAGTAYQLTNRWRSEARFHAAVETEVAVGAPRSNAAHISFTITTSTTTPTIAPDVALSIDEGTMQGMTLNAGEYIWFAGLEGDHATVEV